MTDLPEPDPIAADLRRQRRRRKLPPDAACLLCGASDPDVLTVPSLLEDHHVFGRAAAPDVTVVLCRNCHAIQTGKQHDHDALPTPGRTRPPDSLIERVARALQSLAQLVHDLAHTLTGYAQQLFMLARQLDLAVPGWREWDAAA